MNIEELITLADYLDKQGEYEEAAKLDAIIREAVGPGVEDLEQKHPGALENMPPEDAPAYPPEEREGPIDVLEDTLMKARDTIKYLDLPEELRPAAEQWTEYMEGALSMIDDYMTSRQTAEQDMPDRHEEADSLNLSQFGPGPGGGEQPVGASVRDVFEKLASLADRLDAMGASSHANAIDAFIEKHAGDVVPDVLDWQEADPKGERAKAYDSEYHHSLQIREPKKEQERVDLEGRDKHHVSNYESADKAKGTKKEAVPHSLRTRYSPDLVGVQLARIGDGVYQCPVTGKIYNFETGYTDMDGDYHPGGSVAAQTPDSTGYAVPHRIFDSREQVLNRVN